MTGAEPWFCVTALEGYVATLDNIKSLYFVVSRLIMQLYRSNQNTPTSVEERSRGMFSATKGLKRGTLG